MRPDKDNKFKALLKQAGSDHPTEGFTDSVMQMIEMDSAREAALKSVLKQHPAEGPSFDFTAAVMRRVSTQRQPIVIKPIITKKAWYIIAAVFTFFLIIAFLPGKANSPAIAQNSRITLLINKVQLIPPTLVLAVVLGTILLIGDYLFSGRSKAAVN